MTSFAEREQAFEARYTHDQELRFLVAARRDKLLAGWAADRLRLPDIARSALVTSVLALRDGPGHEGMVLATVAIACREHGRPATAEELAAAMDRCDGQTRRQSTAGTSSPDTA